MRKILGLLGVAICMVAHISAVSADVSIKAFEGFWEGSAISKSETSVTFPISSRDLDVVIRPNTKGGFLITWRTLQRQKGVPGQPDAVLKETTRTYAPTGDGKIWEAASSKGLHDGGVVSWASLQGQALKIYSMAVLKNGSYDMLIYSRTLTGLNMKLKFTSLRDGEVRRTASGTLIKSGK
ncbi:MAG: hypothetical protein V7740_13565 [Pseudomonas marincola]